jgi:hypothetical protein
VRRSTLYILELIEGEGHFHWVSSILNFHGKINFLSVDSAGSGRLFCK